MKPEVFCKDCALYEEVFHRPFGCFRKSRRAIRNPYTGELISGGVDLVLNFDPNQRGHCRFYAPDFSTRMVNRIKSWFKKGAA